MLQFAFFLATTALESPFTHAAAVEFLARHRPAHDAHVGLEAHAALALSSRAASPWAAESPWDVFCDGVLPYCCLDEPRQDWRPLLKDRCLPLVADASSAAEAALALNSRIWDAFGVRYEPNMSPGILAPLDVLAQGKASCTGLSLLLVACCRAVGVPARVAGVGDWGAAHGGGNHVWVEVHAHGAWHHLGAAEPSPLDVTWFDERLHPRDGPRVYASSYAGAQRHEEGGEHLSGCCTFPLPWRDEAADRAAGREVPAVEVTSRYRS